MARAYSHDLRVRVLDTVGAGLSRRDAALRYRVGISTVIRRAAHATTIGETRGVSQRFWPEKFVLLAKAHLGTIGRSQGRQSAGSTPLERLGSP